MYQLIYIYRNFATVVVTLLLVSCNTQLVTTTKGSYVNFVSNSIESDVSEADIAKVAIFYKNTPDFEYLEIGIVEAIAYGNEAGLEDLFSELKKQAAIIGSDGVHKIDIQRYNQTGNAIHATAMAIKKR